MSRKSLVNFLQTLDNELKGRSNLYRRNTADRREHTFVYLPRVLVEELYEEFKFRGILNVFDDAKFKAFIGLKANAILSLLRTNANTLSGNRQVTVASNQHYLRVTLATESNPKKDLAYNNFTKLKTIYTNEINKFVVDLVNYLEKEYKIILTKSKKEFDRNSYSSRLVLTDERVEKGSDLFEGGHVEGEGVLETRIRDAIDTSFNKNYSKRASSEILKSNLKVLGLDLEVVRDDSDSSHTFFIQSRVGNQAAGIISAKQKAELQKQLKEALARLDSKLPIAGLKGSDSILEKKEKKLLAKTANPFKALKNVQLQGFAEESKNIRRSASKKGSTKISKKIEPQKRVIKPKISLAKKKTKGVASSPLALIALINKDLPRVVQANMGPPRLENRTGRFAASARVVSVNTTTQGFPSFAYTYQTYPYQTFEVGYAQGSQDRDPRNIINKSIREIAAQMAIGRFYTRRV